MWIYPAAPNQAPASPSQVPTSSKNTPAALSQAPAASVASKELALSTETPAEMKKKKRKGKACRKNGFRGMAAAYFVGMLAASLLCGNSSGRIKDFIAYYLDFSLKIYKSKDWMLVFSTEFMGDFLQLTAAMLCGFCAFGAPLLVLLLFLKGIGSGLIVGGLYATRHWQGLVINAVLFWVPEVLFSILLIAFCSMARRSSKHLAGICFESAPECSGTSAFKNLFFKYLIFSVCTMLPGMLSAVLAYLFSSVL